MSKTTWRLLITDTDTGAQNMAVDQAIMEAVAQGHVPPTLRLYAWVPPCLSLGYMQPMSDVDHERLAARGWELVRRMTGGRAILHTDELTYSVAVQADTPIVAGDIVASYRRLSQALLTALLRLGANVDADKRTQSQRSTKGPVCFEVPSHYEITASGKKLVGSAQVRKFGAVLQHGSLPLTGDITRIVDALVFPDEDKREAVRERVRRRAATLEGVTGQAVAWDEAAAALADSFKDTFDLTFTNGDLTPDEQTRAEDLRASVYTTDDWNARF
ncbi:MAG: lipoate--protein ligase family protein [Anaerolineae bacterium]|nr:lipoate--protein ligase family protein [Anaerolineae bacterium]